MACRQGGSLRCFSWRCVPTSGSVELLADAHSEFDEVSCHHCGSRLRRGARAHDHEGGRRGEQGEDGGRSRQRPRDRTSSGSAREETNNDDRVDV